ncbi:hypothetical protein SAICODRAFT_22438 [Saitoella complicata NRRL Y-17804]|uniref:Trafficking protein particle complex subunit 11 domain-containing protein n=1 Tax=Saitoella complicata (strain BCRC 22490 / CBS 7301 / JCM 7358 / NBRC 10748 / NRRL Y-17804) TaxID=698492 RepID=A0A0E9NHI9_SAICN|nr:uncharacterized protein SAICODRAFT_22438 [Saitoella complicata NRRL Y-17804]ODQ56006.1 hypothetical protein SAICODRAFT_22438 [Saitoella complicata NRRL Y-17804]GAO49352.1 hypothetical protein G7K_3503-t1 [Saitoella complicata NRRL Y-17804]
MDSYPREYTEHLRPLVLVAGLTPPATDRPSSPNATPSSSPPRDRRPSMPVSPQNSSAYLTPPRPDQLRRRGSVWSPMPPIDQELAKQLLGYLTVRSGSNVWEASAMDVSAGTKYVEGLFRVLPVERAYRLPAKKARPAPSPLSSFRSSSPSGRPRTRSPSPVKPSTDPLHSPAPPAPINPANLHSPLSPLTPGSPLFPDGLVTPRWVAKYARRLPSAFVGFYEIYTGDDEQTKALKDQELVKELTELKRAFADRGIKFVAVVTSKKTTGEALDLDTRLNNLRRAAQLDARTGLLFLGPSSAVELRGFVANLQEVLYPTAVEFYNDILKHARKKSRNRGSSPAESLRWSLRTDFKVGVMAEFLQNIELADRNYRSAYMTLLEMFNNTSILPPRSQRWIEARLLSDSLNLKICKMCLYLDLPADAMKTFNQHIAHTARLSSTHWSPSTGIDTPEWYSWLARQRRAFGDLVVLAEGSGFDFRSLEVWKPTVPGPGVQVGGWRRGEVVRHAGYEYWEAVECMKVRKIKMKEAMAREKRAVGEEGGEGKEGDEAGVDVDKVIGEITREALEQFRHHGDMRMVLYLSQELAQTNFEAGNYDIALTYAKKLVAEYRREEWTTLLEGALRTCLACAQELGNHEDIMRFSWELLSKDFKGDEASSNAFFAETRDLAAAEDGKPLVLDSSGSTAPIHMSFVFNPPMTSVTMPIVFQVTLEYNVHPSTPPLSLKSCELLFDGIYRPVHLEHNANEEASKAGSLVLLKLEDDGDILRASGDLSFQPGEKKTFQMVKLAKHEGVVNVRSGLLHLDSPGARPIEITCDLSSPDKRHKFLWLEETNNRQRSRELHLDNPRSCTVLQKPAKLQIQTDFKGLAYCGEAFPLILTVMNEEDEAIRASFQVSTASYEGDPLEVAAKPDVESIAAPDSVFDIGEVKPNEIGSGTCYILCPRMRTDATVEFTVKYSLASDPDTKIRKTLEISIPVMEPFHAAYDFSPRVNSKWPEPFSTSDPLTSFLEIAQSWALTSTLSSLGSITMEIEGLELVLEDTLGPASVKVRHGHGCRSDGNDNLVWDSSIAHKAEFVLDCTKAEDQVYEESFVDTVIAIHWRRHQEVENAEAHWNTAYLMVPRLHIPSFEPRVLAETILYPSFPRKRTIIWHLENPTNLILNLSLFMHPSEHFTCSGVKHTQVRLLPFSAQTIQHNVIALTQGWLKLPSFKVIEVQSERELRMVPASADIRLDREGGMSIQVVDDEVDEKV